jgi:hypothetical protein
MDTSHSSLVQIDHCPLEKGNTLVRIALGHFLLLIKTASSARLRRQAQTYKESDEMHRQTLTSNLVRNFGGLLLCPVRSTLSPDSSLACTLLFCSLLPLSWPSLVQRLVISRRHNISGWLDGSCCCKSPWLTRAGASRKSPLTTRSRCLVSKHYSRRGLLRCGLLATTLVISEQLRIVGSVGEPGMISR